MPSTRWEAIVGVIVTGAGLIGMLSLGCAALMLLFAREDVARVSVAIAMGALLVMGVIMSVLSICTEVRRLRWRS